MADDVKKNKNKEQEPLDLPQEEAAEAAQSAPEAAETAPAEAAETAEAEVQEETPDPLAEAEEKLKAEQDKYLRLAAEYDNYRKRSQKEKDNIYRDARADTIEKFLPVFDNLTLALNQETEDTAYKKGVEMTMNGLLEILKKLDVTVYGEPGDTFSPDQHNAVMHMEDGKCKEGEIVQVFQKGFKLGDKVIRFAMVQTAN